MDQLKLFWGENPKVIVVLLQLMQFYFAVTAAYFLIFWGTDMGPGGKYVDKRIIEWHWLVLTVVSRIVILLCYLSQISLWCTFPIIVLS